MADVMEAFLRGRAAAQAETEHKDALEENKIRLAVLKHQMDGLKIEDQVRARALAKQNLDLMQGQPAADLPADVSTNLPSTSHAGAMTGLPDVIASLVRGAQGMDGGQPGPSSLPAPNAQATTPQQTRTIRPVEMPGVPGLGVPGVSVRPQSLEELIKQTVAVKQAEPYTLNEGDRRFVGGTQIAAGGARTTSTSQRPLVVNGHVIDATGKEIANYPAPKTPQRPTVVNGHVLDATGKEIANYPPAGSASGAGGPTMTQRAQAERWKAKELSELEVRFKKSQPTYGTNGVPIPAFDSAGAEIAPMTKEELAAAKQQIQDSYLAQIGAGKAKAAAKPTAGGMIEAKDPEGNIHHAPAGTPLPDGWTLLP